MNDFASEGASYAVGRPIYPDSLYSWIADQSGQRKLVWDCGAGSGQASHGLARHFDRVIATDSSLEQLNHAQSHPRISFLHCSAEMPDDAVRGFNAVCGACAVHWFDLEAFYKNVRRLASRNAVIAVWTYEWPWTDSSEVNEELAFIKDKMLDDYWPVQSSLYLNHYKDLTFPFQQITPPTFHCSVGSSLDDLCRFIFTWSPIKRYIAANGFASLDRIRSRLETAWLAHPPDGQLTLPLYMKVGRILKREL